MPYFLSWCSSEKCIVDQTLVHVAFYYTYANEKRILRLSRSSVWMSACLYLWNIGLIWRGFEGWLHRAQDPSFLIPSQNTSLVCAVFAAKTLSACRVLPWIGGNESIQMEYQLLNVRQVQNKGVTKLSGRSISDLNFVGNKWWLSARWHSNF